MIYGYALQKLTTKGLLEMKEVTFAASPQVLREIADFLASMAVLMESGRFRNTHRHIRSFVSEWDNDSRKKT